MVVLILENRNQRFLSAFLSAWIRREKYQDPKLQDAHEGTGIGE